MNLTIHQTMLPHTGHEDAIAFYRDSLGFEVRGDVGYNGMHWITVGPAGQPDVSIVLYPLGADPGVTEEEERVIEAMMAKGTYASLNLASTDLGAVFERLAQTGAEIVQEPTDQPYGIRDGAVRDPAGNLLRIQQVS
ncbi:VOC family protein [Microbacterium sp. Marseille-Q6965]|uniref:VOC family protein n=1 Tax=Microbacterium sp. Marseille-Q6965 TaxID=2965072 RepID=UPI0021B82A5B|nr:VOC family protein [Microbacterium sp. Marseille-Q6965]